MSRTATVDTTKNLPHDVQSLISSFLPIVSPSENDPAKPEQYNLLNLRSVAHTWKSAVHQSLLPDGLLDAINKDDDNRFLVLLKLLRAYSLPQPKITLHWQRDVVKAPATRPTLPKIFQIESPSSIFETTPSADKTREKLVAELLTNPILRRQCLGAISGSERDRIDSSDCCVFFQDKRVIIYSAIVSMLITALGIGVLVAMDKPNWIIALGMGSFVTLTSLSCNYARLCKSGRIEIRPYCEKWVKKNETLVNFFSAPEAVKHASFKMKDLDKKPTEKLQAIKHASINMKDLDKKPTEKPPTRAREDDNVGEAEPLLARSNSFA